MLECDLDCSIEIDADAPLNAKASEVKKVRVAPGQHLIRGTSQDGKDKVERDIEIKDKAQLVVHLNLVPVQTARLAAEKAAAPKPIETAEHSAASPASGSSGTSAHLASQPVEAPTVAASEPQPATIKPADAHPLSPSMPPNGPASIHLFRSTVSKKGYGDPAITLDGTKLVDRIKASEHYDVRVGAGAHSIDLKGGHFIRDHTFPFNCSPGSEVYLKIDVATSGFHAEWTVEAMDAFNGRAGVADSKSIGHADLALGERSSPSVSPEQGEQSNQMKVGTSSRLGNRESIAAQPVSNSAVGSPDNAADPLKTEQSDTEISLSAEINGRKLRCKGTLFITATGIRYQCPSGSLNLAKDQIKEIQLVSQIGIFWIKTGSDNPVFRLLDANGKPAGSDPDSELAFTNAVRHLLGVRLKK